LESLNATPEAFAKKADRFLEAHPEGALRADLLMKMAVRYYNTQQYAPAKARFLQLVEEEPESNLVEASLYWAGKSALGSLAKGCEDEAIKLWDRVAAAKGSMRMEARLEQAKLNQRRNPPAALQVFETILKSSPPPDASLRYTVLCLRGETLMATAGDNADQWREALSGFDQVISSPDASVYWKQQACVRKGGCLENLKQDAAALEAYQEAMAYSKNSASTNESDYHWFFRAGGKAIRLLESKKNWAAAVAIAQQLAEAPGPQADAARERANRLTTEHFLWQDD
jgi:tetratricopeptide (TPR) repeat protein